MLSKYEIRKFIEKFDSPIILQIGVGFPDDTLEFISVFDDLDFQLWAFEPDPRNIDQFRKTINDPRVRLVDGAIGNIDGKIQFNVSPGDTRLSGSLKEPGDDLYKIWPDIFKDMEFPKIEVECMKLDTICKYCDELSFVFADVQGAEDLMIEGGIDTFTNKVHYLYTEYSNSEIYQDEPNLDKILSMLPDYEIVQLYKNSGKGDLSGGDVLLRNRRFV